MTWACAGGVDVVLVNDDAHTVLADIEERQSERVKPRESSIGHRDFGPWTALDIMLIWVVVALLGGYLVLRRRDA